jgi:hypothetical protein
MTTTTLIICSSFAVLMGFLTQQTIETLINAYLILMPFNIRTTR